MFATPPPSSTIKLDKFAVDRSSDDVQNFSKVIKHSRLAPKTFESNQTDTNRYGVTYDWISSTKQYWQTKYSWSQRLDVIEQIPQFTTKINDETTNFDFTIHFMALFSQRSDAVPIVLLHGWPGSFLEFQEILKLMSEKHTTDDLPYHLVAPSLPGYAYSSGPPLDYDFKTEDIARIVDKLMTGLFPGQKYVAQGGDIGSYVCRVLSSYDTCRAIHLNFCMMDDPGNIDESKICDVEKQGNQRADEFGSVAFAYALEHGTRPATIGFCLDASPIALLAWIGEKFLTWTDDTPQLDDILDSISLYWMTSSFPRCIYPYRQFHGTSKGNYSIHANPKYHCEKPMGYSYFPKEVAPIPVAWAMTTGNMVWYKRHERGGHFAALEKPKELMEDIETFVELVKRIDGTESRDWPAVQP